MNEKYKIAVLDQKKCDFFLNETIKLLTLHSENEGETIGYLAHLACLAVRKLGEIVHFQNLPEEMKNSNATQIAALLGVVEDQLKEARKINSKSLFN